MLEALNKKRRLIFLIVNLLISGVTIAFVFTFSGRFLSGDKEGASLFLALAILSEAIYQAFFMIVQKDKNDRIRLIFLFVLYTSAAVVAFLARGNYIYYFISTGLVILTVAISQILRAIFRTKDRTKGGIFTNVLIGLTLIGFSVAIFIAMNEANIKAMVATASIALLFLTLKNIMFPTLRVEKINLLLDILVKTHAIDVIIGCLALVIAFSFLMPMFEPNLTNFWDAMWYCFAVITTIGFGDFAAVSTVGRVLTVLLGIYGLVVVAIFTSVIVNFYNQISKKEEQEAKQKK